MKLLNKLFLASLLISQMGILAEPLKSPATLTWREKAANFYQETSENILLTREYLENRYEIALEDAKEKLEQLNNKYKETKEWIKKNPKKTAAAIAGTIITLIVIIKIIKGRNSDSPSTTSLNGGMADLSPNSSTTIDNTSAGRAVSEGKMEDFSANNNNSTHSTESNVVSNDHYYADFLNTDHINNVSKSFIENLKKVAPPIPLSNTQDQ